MENKTVQLEKINALIKEEGQKGFPVELISDGFHSFKELYSFRKIYNAALFNEWAKDKTYLENEVGSIIEVKSKYNVHKSWKHHDGELCFGGGWFIVVAQLPTGQISNHYEASDWDLFQVPIADKALFEFDNHSSQDVLNRLKDLINAK